jgi:hypothetical protein
MAAATVTPTVIGRITPTPTVQMIPVTLTATATVYATASGGLPFDLYSLFTTISPLDGLMSSQDIIGFIGVSTLGWNCGTFAVGTATSSTIPCTVRLWNGITEAADGATTATIKGYLMVQRGALGTVL